MWRHPIVCRLIVASFVSNLRPVAVATGRPSSFRPGFGCRRFASRSGRTEAAKVNGITLTSPDKKEHQEATAMMKQWFEAKAKYPNHVICFRMGDFYEMFYQDAEDASQILGITLTKRGKDRGNDIPFAGFPYFSLDTFLPRLVRAGRQVAVVEQRPRDGSKGVLVREVSRLESSSTMVSDDFLDPKRNNFLACIYDDVNVGSEQQQVAVAWADISTGEFHYCTCERNIVETELHRINPVEVVVPASSSLLRVVEPSFTTRKVDESFFHPEGSDYPQKAELFVSCLRFAGPDRSVASLSVLEEHACVGVFNFFVQSRMGDAPHLSHPTALVRSSCMFIDAASRRSLELSESQSEYHRHSMLSVLDRTVTPAGGRLLASRLSNPLLQIEVINRRLDDVELFVNMLAADRDTLRSTLRDFGDVERSARRICADRGSPRDLARIRTGLQVAHRVSCLMAKKKQHLVSPLSAPLVDLMTELTRALADFIGTSSISMRGFVRPGYDNELDAIASLRDNCFDTVRSLEAKYRSMTGVNSLKVDRTDVLGFFCHVKEPFAEKVSGSPTVAFSRCGTTKDFVRFRTDELTELTHKVNSAAQEAADREAHLFYLLSARVRQVEEELVRLCSAVSNVDVSLALGSVASELGYCRPSIVTEPVLVVRGGRHPIIELSRVKSCSSVAFTPNDCTLTLQSPFWLITGCNMGGKSTFLRQNALIAIMAQMGSFVPASSAIVGLVDSVLSRVGSADDITRDRSTFMMEMVETSLILKKATNHSIVICDELGRGSSPGDGLAIAQAVMEYILTRIRCRTLFATHFHELARLEGQFSSLRCFQFSVERSLSTNNPDSLVFTHRLVPGAATSSHGVYIAELAGLPAWVVARANELLEARSSSSLLEGNGAHTSLLLVDPLRQKLVDSLCAFDNILWPLQIDDITARRAADVVRDLRDSASVLAGDLSRYLEVLQRLRCSGNLTASYLEPKREILDDRQDAARATEYRDLAEQLILGVEKMETLEVVVVDGRVAYIHAADGLHCQVRDNFNAVANVVNRVLALEMQQVSPRDAWNLLYESQQSWKQIWHPSETMKL